MKIDRQALIFGVIVFAIVAVVAALVWFSSLFRTPDGGGAAPIESFFSSLFPFGTTTRPIPGVGPGDTPPPAGPTPDLRQVTANPVSGFTFRAGNIFRYIERETGHIFETPFDSYKTTRVSNTTIPGAFAIAWLPSDSFVLQYFGGNGAIRNFFATLASSTPDQTLVGRFLDEAAEIHPAGKEGEIFRVRRSASGTLVDRVKIERGESQTVFSSSLRSIRVLPAGGALFVGTAPSSVDGFLYRVEDDRSLRRLVGSARSLVALPHPSGRYMAYSTESGLYVLDTRDSRTYVSQVRALAEKCAWFPGDAPLLFCGISGGGAASVEAWYMGVRSLSDSAWIIDPVAGTATIVSHLDLDAGRTIDMWKPSVSPDGEYAAFMDKTDLSLWLLRLP